MAGFLGNIIRKNLQGAPQATPSLRPRLKSWYEEDSPADTDFTPPDERDPAAEDEMPSAVEPGARPRQPAPPAITPRSQSLLPQRVPPPAPQPATPASAPRVALEPLASRMGRIVPAIAPRPIASRVQRSPVERGSAPQPIPASSAPSLAPLSGRESAPTPAGDAQPAEKAAATRRPAAQSPALPLPPRPDAPPGPAQSEPAQPLQPQLAPTIRVTIGRIEVRATQPAGSAQAAPAPSAKSRAESARAIPALSLADYLKRRSSARNRSGR